MFAKKEKKSKKSSKGKRSCAKEKIETVLKEVKQLSMEAEDFFDSMKHYGERGTENADK